MKPLLYLLSLIGLLTLFNSAQAQLQLPGSPQALSTTNRALGNINSGMIGLGNSRGSSTGPSGQQNGQTGQPNPTTGNDWFIHRNQGPGSFVGASSQSQTGFVGAQNATGGTAQTAVTAKVPVTNLNDTLMARGRTDLYDPRLELGFESKAHSVEAISSALARQLNSCPSLHLSSPISVLVAGQTATVRGEVASEWDRAMAEQMVLFEPGISEVQNQLTLKPLSPLRSPGDRK